MNKKNNSTGSRLTRRGFMRLATVGALGAAWSGCSFCPTNPRRTDGVEFAFGVLTDAQYCDAPTAGSRHYRASIGKLADCVETLNERDLSFVIHLGDFIDRDAVSFDHLLPVYRRSRAPIFHALGNHDFSVADQEKASVPARLGMSGKYYEFKRPGWRFIVLDGNDVSLQAHVEGSARRRAAEQMLQRIKERKLPNAQAWNGAVGQQQLAWLRERLLRARSTGERVVIFCHFPVLPRAGHNLWNDEALVRLLDSFDCVVAYFCGHNHAGGYALRRGTHYLTFRGMVETAEENAFSIVEAREGRLEVTGFGRETSRTLRFDRESAEKV